MFRLYMENLKINLDLVHFLYPVGCGKVNMLTHTYPQ